MELKSAMIFFPLGIRVWERYVIRFPGALNELTFSTMMSKNGGMDLPTAEKTAGSAEPLRPTQHGVW